MNAEGILEQASRLGVTITVVGDRIQYRPASAAPSDFVEILRKHKAEVMAKLSPTLCVEAEAAHLLTCPVCGANQWWPRHDGQWVCGVCHPEPPGGSMRMKGFACE